MQVKSMTKIALFLVLFFIFSNIIPPINLVGVPITLQMCLIMLLPFFLDIKEICYWYIALVLGTIIGIPFMAGFSSGINVFLGPTAGYIYGWLPMMYVIKLAQNNMHKFNLFMYISIAIIIDYVCGAAFFTLNSGGNILTNFITLSGVFIFFDLIKAVAVLLILDKIPARILTLQK